jgi:hypothetical protein
LVVVTYVQCDVVPLAMVFFEADLLLLGDGGDGE